MVPSIVVPGMVIDGNSDFRTIWVCPEGRLNPIVEAEQVFAYSSK